MSLGIRFVRAVRMILLMGAGVEYLPCICGGTCKGSLNGRSEKFSSMKGLSHFSETVLFSAFPAQFGLKQ